MELRPPRPGETSLEVLFAYSEYMRERFSMALLELPLDLFLKPLGLDWMFGSLRDLAGHIVATEDQWVGSILQGRAGPGLEAAAFPDAATLVRSWEEVRGRTREYLARADEREIARVVVAPFAGSPRLTVRQVLLHLLVHETHHRGQLTAALRMLGVAPPPSDFYDYVAEQLQ